MTDLSEKVSSWLGQLLCQPSGQGPLSATTGLSPTRLALEQEPVKGRRTTPPNMAIASAPAGALKVGVQQSTQGAKWVPPEEARQLLRKIPRPLQQANRSTRSQVPALPLPLALGEVTKGCKLAGHSFKDTAFKLSTNAKVTAVLRPDQIARHEGKQPSRDWRLFRGRPRADDVQQGELGDCWFLSALAALAEFQEGRLLHALLPGQTTTSDVGAYIVRLCIGGRWREILVDDQFPCIGGGMYYTQLAYCVTKRQQLWATIIEKAFAKVCGSYEATRGGEASEALEMLTGWPCTLSILSRPDFDAEMLWATLCSSRDANFIMTCSTKSVQSRSLEPDHVYSLLNVHEVTDPRGGKNVRLLKIRNPHNRSKWEGDWSDGSTLWTPQLRQQLGCPEGGNPQVFFMGFDDFVREFAHCTICRIRSSEWHEAREPLHLPANGVPGTGLEVEVSEMTECCISLVQPGMRLRGGPFHPQQSGPLACFGFVLVPLEATPKTNASATAVAQLRHAPTVSADCFLQAGRYLLVPLGVHDGPALEATWVFVSSRKVTLKERNLDANTLKHAWATYVRDRDPDGIRFHGATLRLGKSDAGAVVALVENNTERHLAVQLAFRSHCMRYSRGAAEGCDWLAPGCGQILQVAQPLCSEDPMRRETAVSWHQSHTFKMTTQGPTTAWHSPALKSTRDLHTPFQLRTEPEEPAWCAQQ